MGFYAFLLAGAFIAWLMWSSNSQKQTFLAVAWLSMLVLGGLNMLYLIFR